MNLEKEQALRARAKEAPTLIPVLLYLADVMQAVLDEGAE